MILNTNEMPAHIKPFRVLNSDKIRSKSSPMNIEKGVTTELREVLWRMIKTCTEDGGVGLAAPQVGIFKRLIVVKVLESENTYQAYFNPSWKAYGGAIKVEALEGCLSVPNRSVRIARFDAILASGFRLDKERPEQFSELLMGTQARIFQHEVDHLEGISILERK